MTNRRSTGQLQPVPVMITSPLEPEHAERITTAYADQIELIYRPDWLPPPRYIADHGGDPTWRRSAAQTAQWYDAMRRSEVMWDFPEGSVRDDQSLLTLCPNLRWVQTTSAGVGPLVQRLGLQGSDLLVTTASGIHARPLTEFVFAALLFHTKRIAYLQSEQRNHRWQRYAASELTGQTMAIVGPGRIGREVARIARCFGMTVWAMARDNDAARAESLGVDRLFTRDDLYTMLQGADCVVLCTPHTPETEGLIGANELDVLKPDVVLVNIARGVVIDEAALIERLRQGRIGLAALDVFQTEPLPPNSPLWDFPNVLINPHSASTAASENRKLTDRFIENLGHYLRGELDQMAPILDKQRLY